MRVAITGYKGFIGNYLTDFLEESGYSLTKISLSENSVESLDLEGVDVLIHLSGLAHQAHTVPFEEYIRVNQKQTFSLGQRARKASVNHFINFSSIKVYGDLGLSGASESSHCNPRDSYGISKLGGEQKLRNLEDQFFHVTSLRVPLVYGPGSKANMKMLVGLVRKFGILPFGGIDNKRMIISLYNLGKCVDLIIRNKIYGIVVPSDPYPISTSQLVENIASAVGKRIINFKIPVFFRPLVKFILKERYDKLFLDYYIDNQKSMSLMSTAALHDTAHDLYEYIGRNEE